jgi:hypothetical protein
MVVFPAPEPAVMAVEAISADSEPVTPAIGDEPAADYEDLAARRAGAEAREQAVALRQAAPVRTFLARVLMQRKGCPRRDVGRSTPTGSSATRWSWCAPRVVDQ